MMFELLLDVRERFLNLRDARLPWKELYRRAKQHNINLKRFITARSHRIESVRKSLLITPYPTGRLFGGGAVPGTSCQATVVPSLRDISQQALVSAHKYLRIRDLYQELTFATQRGLSQSCNSYNSFVFIVLWRQFLGRGIGLHGE
jgi:hypothetical protein